MRFFATIPLLCALHGASSQMTGKLGDAMAISNNPRDLVYSAMIDGGATHSVKGKVAAMSGPGGKGVVFNMTIMGLPMDGGPYSYHLHDQPVSADGNCSSTLAHLDPYQRGQAVACNMTAPETCEVGDLSGKHGKIDGPSATKSFTDLYAALVPGIGAFFGNRSIVIHYANSTRLACANFTMVTMPTKPKPGKPEKPGRGCGHHN
ncbi:Cu,Zn superoxide dismutase-like protein [Cladorrhinum sp. PSN259]|nr:Cu,Zn superoxide dismutase-like protein [Cladorrhinum sp. PSN259]